MRPRYHFTIYRTSFQELVREARLRAETLFGCPASDEAFVGFEVREYASTLAAGPVMYQADVTVEMDFS